MTILERKLATSSAEMKFRVKGLSNGFARAGTMEVSGSVTETPALLITTRKGLPAFISPDLLSSIDSRLLQFSPLHFLEGISLKTISQVGGLHHLLGLKEHVFAAVPRDSILSLPDYQGANKIGASFQTPCGRALIKPANYMEMISAMKPNMWTTLADEVPAWVSRKRNIASVDRTIRWLDDCLAFTTAPGGAVFGSIVGGSDVEERKRCAHEVARRNVSGFYIGGFGLGENVDDRSALLRATTEDLPEDKPRMICGLGLPEEVLQGIAAGIDLFESTYIYHLTLGGFALAFPFDNNIGKNGYDDRWKQSDICGDGTKLNLKATIYRKDTNPILVGCRCYTCQNHTRAYINHLLNVHEMLAHILLEIHNTHHYLGFFRVIREEINRGTFEDFRRAFVENRRERIFAAAADDDPVANAN